MKSAGSVTIWLHALEAGDEDAAHQLWERYRTEMYEVARRRMKRLKRHDVVDEEDIILSAFAAICLAARKGQLAGVSDRNELWALMFVAIQRKIGQREQYVGAAKRNVNQLLQQADRLDEFGSRLERLVSPSPSPVSEIIRAEDAEELLRKLNDPDLRAVAIMRLAGHSNDEIAVEMGYARRTIQRMLTVIRSCWKADATTAEIPV